VADPTITDEVLDAFERGAYSLDNREHTDRECWRAGLQAALPVLLAQISAHPDTEEV
jgi:hypothetical protein